MRAFEALSLLATAMTFIAMVAPWPRSATWARVLAPVAVVFAVVQASGEGVRWQLFPGLVLTGLCFVVWARDPRVRRSGRIDRASTPRIVFIPVVVLGALALALSTALALALPVFRFPLPQGPDAIGTVVLHWSDDTRHEVFGADRIAHRELVAQIWYPAAAQARTPPVAYIPRADAVLTAMARLHGFPPFCLTHIAYVKTHATLSPAISPARPAYPVVIILEGLTGYRQMCLFEIEHLVSHGYVVVAIDQPGAAAMIVLPDGRTIAGRSKPAMDPLIQQSLAPAGDPPRLDGQLVPAGIIPYFASDVSFALDQLARLNSGFGKSPIAGHLDLERVGVSGVSFGGMVGAQACLQDARLKACLVMDAAMPASVVTQGLRIPAMWITRPTATMRLERARAGGWTEKDIAQTQTTMRTVYERLPGDGFFVQVPGMFHVDLTDVALFSPLFSRAGFSGPIGAQRAHEIINAYALAFFDKTLKGRAPALLEGSSRRYPDVRLEARRAPYFRITMRRAPMNLPSTENRAK